MKIPLDPFEIRSISDELERKVEDLLVTTHDSSIHLYPFWKQPIATEYFLDVPGGQIRVLHIVPPSSIGKRPIVFVPGWGTAPSEFCDFYEALHQEVELIYIETREKRSSKIKFWGTRMNMTAKATDIKIALDYFHLVDRDYILMGSCWGASILLSGIEQGLFHPPTVIALDPMNKLWASHYFLKYGVPLIPGFILSIFKPFIRWFKMRKFHEPVQRQRALSIVDNAVIWKWKRAAQQTCDFELMALLPYITQEVLIFNGTADTVHQPEFYPRIAQALSKGRFFFLKTDESNRERLFGLIGREFAKITAADSIPLCFQPFERKLYKEL